MMTAADVISVLDALAEGGISVWLDGGWGVDALVGEQTREHEDLDMVVSAEHLDRALTSLAALGYEIAENLRPTRLVLDTGDGSRIDFHPVVFDRDGSARQIGAGPNGGDALYPAAGFTGSGLIAGREVACLTPTADLLASSFHLPSHAIWGLPTNPHPASVDTDDACDNIQTSAMPLTLKIDPWDPAYESALQIDDDTSAPVEVDPFVETKDWSAPPAMAAWPRPDAIVFIDGVQRVDTRVIGDEDGRLVFGAFSSLAVGAVISRPAGAGVTPELPERVLALTSGVSCGPIDVACGRLLLRFHAHSTAITTLAGVNEALRSARQAAETRLGERMADDGYPLVVVDGPLGFWPTRHSSVVGLVKTIHKRYLATEQADLLGRLGPGARTPIFRIGRDRPAFSWYMRLSPRHPIEHPWAGIVRLEAMEFVGIEAAVRLADLTAQHLPGFASSPIRDPRAPQNLYPISALEDRLRRQLGDREFIRRSIEAHFYRTGAAA